MYRHAYEQGVRCMREHYPALVAEFERRYPALRDELISGQREFDSLDGTVPQGPGGSAPAPGRPAHRG
jgi:hypothetical protein